MAATATQEIQRIVDRDHQSPHSFLGAHPVEGGVVVRAYRPDASSIRVLPEGGEPVELERIHPAGVFEGVVEGARPPLRYRLEVAYPSGTFTFADPYAFLPTLGELDVHLAGEGRHEHIYER